MGGAVRAMNACRDSPFDGPIGDMDWCIEDVPELRTPLTCCIPRSRCRLEAIKVDDGFEPAL